jgi:hypothetical protein
MARAMDIATLTQLLTPYVEKYGALAAVSLAALRIGAIIGRRFVRKDRPRWYPHLPPLPVKPTNPLSLLLDVAACAFLAFMAFGLLVSVRNHGVAHVAKESWVLIVWMLLFVGFGRYWVAYDHEEAVHQYRYRTDPAYRVESDLAEEEEERRQKEFSAKMNGCDGYGLYADRYH